MVLTLFDLHRSILTKRSDDGERYRLIKQTSRHPARVSRLGLALGQPLETPWV